MASCFDVIVIGAGVMGAATADACAARGASTLLIDRFNFGHTNGSSHGDGRIYRFAYEEDIYVNMMRRALVGWQQLEVDTGHSIMHRTGGLDIAQKGDTHLAALQAQYTRNRIPFEVLHPHACAERFPQFRLEASQEAVYQPDAGVLLATKAVMALCARAARRGCATRPETHVTRITPAGAAGGGAAAGRAVVETAAGERFAAGRVVVCAGPWLPGMCRRLGLALPARVSMETVAYFAPREPPPPPPHLPPLHSPPPPPPPRVDHTYRSMPIFIPWVNNGLGNYGYYGLPQIEHKGVKASAHYCGPAVPDPDCRPGPDHPQAQRVIQSTARLVRDLLPHLDSDEPARVERCYYTVTPDHDFVLGPHPDPAWAGIFLAGGGSGHAFKFGTAIGEMMASLALDSDGASRPGDSDPGGPGAADWLRDARWRAKFDPGRFRSSGSAGGAAAAGVGWDGAGGAWEETGSAK